MSLALPVKRAGARGAPLRRTEIGRRARSGVLSPHGRVPSHRRGNRVAPTHTIKVNSGHVGGSLSHGYYPGANHRSGDFDHSGIEA